MDISRRSLINATAAGAAAGALAATPEPARAAPLTSTLGRDATQYGVRPNSPDDQTKVLQRAIDAAASAQMPLALPPGAYRTGALRLPNGGQLVGVRGATVLKFTGGASLIASEGASGITLTGLALDGAGIKLADRRGLVHFQNGLDVRVQDCDIVGSGGYGIWFESIAGEVSGNTIRKTANTAFTSFDALGLLVAQNTIQDASDNGIEILRHTMGDDGTIVVNNRIDDIKAGPGGSGQHGNAINAFRAGNVIVSGNRIRNCDYSAVRGNSASNIQITGNSVSNVREVALYSEFAFEGAVIANNTVDVCAVGVSVANFNEGGRMVTVHGNVIRNILPKRPIGTAPDDDAGIGIVVEADARRHQQCDRECPLVRDHGRLGKIPPRCDHHRQRPAQFLRRHRGVGGAGGRHRAGQQQPDFRIEGRRDRRIGSCQGGNQRSRRRRNLTLCADCPWP